MAQVIRATGRRKTSVARVRLTPGGDGSITVNGKTMDDYFPRETSRMAIMRPLVITEKAKAVTVQAKVDGGGPSGQAGALSHGIARALIKWEADLRGLVKKEGLLTRDDRMKERKKYGQKGARKRFQFSKR